MAEMASEQDEVNTVLWLATWAGKMGPLHLLSITGKVPFWSYDKSHIGELVRQDIEDITRLARRYARS